PTVGAQDLPTPVRRVHPDRETGMRRQEVLGYTSEYVELLLPPLATTGNEAVGSMGTDTPLAVLSERPHLLFNYFKQLFAQVTNPPIDAIREEVIMAEDVMLGNECNLLDETPGHCHRLHIPRPILNNKELEKIRHIRRGSLKATTLGTIFSAAEGAPGLEKAL